MSKARSYIQTALHALGYEEYDIDGAYYNEDYETTVILREPITESTIIDSSGPLRLTPCRDGAVYYRLGKYIKERGVTLTEDQARRASSCFSTLESLAGNGTSDIPWES